MEHELDRPAGMSGSALAGEAGLSEWEAVIRGVYGPSTFEMSRPDAFAGLYRQAAGSLVSTISGNVARVRTDGCVGQWRDGQSVFVVVAQEGETRMSQDGASLVLRPGDITIADPHRSWDYRFSGRFSHLSVIVPRSVLSLHPDGPDATVLWHCPSQSRLARAIHALSRLMAEDEAGAPDLPGEAASLHAALIDLLAGGLATGATTEPACDSPAPRQDPRYRRALLAIDDHLRDPGLSSAHIANILGMSLRTLHRLFQQQGTTVSGHLLTRRLDLCYRQLQSPRHRDRTITDIAFECGFNDLSHFSRSFRRRFGVTPGAVRSHPGHAGVRRAAE
ncbi:MULTISPECIES: helix-turn-helix domain-containing protein [Burkholderia cepacia complex]|uniref:helix-turn-helix domain-containing protein n=1 Tax=Burkholderia cepacia complex TaxID=87882 RepID=UPI0015818596|nr:MULTISPECIES: helix-turn-helix domain-containing protein [Burkholderia cepacia complex]